MSLVVQQLSKIYGQQTALNNISFSVEKGEIAGFLGPNGAGKSTTMKIATGYLPPTSGSVIVEGLDVINHPIGVKRIIGYLPEHNPLYLDLYVREYLEFVGGLYGLKRKALRQRIGEIIDVCGLGPEQNKKLEALSKGYRQRVGIAQSLIHDPSVLILDEPTSGLDPNQLLEVRKLIRDISKNKTVIFSTHILQEVQALCDRVIVLNKGEIVADDRLSNLMRDKATAISIVVEFDGDVPTAALQNIRGVERVEKLGHSKFRIVAKSGVDIRAEVFRFSADKNLSLLGLRLEENSLEDIFRELTVARDPSTSDLSTQGSSLQ
jgi:ABC-2 type transport system ATP-binding protein